MVLVRSLETSAREVATETPTSRWGQKLKRVNRFLQPDHFVGGEVRKVTDRFFDAPAFLETIGVLMRRLA